METVPMNQPSSPTSLQEHRSSTPAHLAVLRGLENPVSSSVLNIADTLTTSAEDDVVADNVRFLRSPVDPQEEWRAENAREETTRERRQTVLDHRTEERERREQMERMLAAESRLSRLRRQDLARSSYGDRVPNQNSLYDWSPSSTHEATTHSDELNALVHEVRQLQPTRNPEILRSIARSQLEAERQAQSRAHTSRFSNSTLQSHESTLRATAIVQSSVRRQRFSDRSRHSTPRHSAESRDPTQRVAAESEMPSRSSTFSPRHPGVIGPAYPSRYEQNRRSWQATQPGMADPQAGSDTSRSPGDHTRPPVESYRRSYLENPSPTSKTPITTPSIDQTIKYLSDLRYSETIEDSIIFAIDAGFSVKDLVTNFNEDFLLDLSSIPEPVETSWLRPGAVLSGFQHAVNVRSQTVRAPGTSSTYSTPEQLASSEYHMASQWSSALSSNHTPWQTRLNDIPPHARRAADPTYRPAPIAPNSRQTAAAIIAQRYGPSPLSPSPAQPAQPAPQDRWPVKVSIHAIDYSTRKLSATMDAFDVPALPHHITGVRVPAHSITTYLEGEILDFKDIAFLTESFPSTVETDATYWRKLEPFKEYADGELVRRLTSKTWLREVCEQYVFMRWKERCFVSRTMAETGDRPTTYPPTPRQDLGQERFSTTYAPFPDGIENCGLTISGFYFVCLRRSDGAVEGLYHDPQSSPYQHLRLASERGGVGSGWEFR